jgi:UDPglucose 6-dehydrogenase
VARRLTVLGTGYLGTTHAACMAKLGFDVLGVDTDMARIAALAAGRLPFHEAGLEPLLARGLTSGRLRFTTSYEEAVAFGDVYFVCVGTPQLPGTGKADLSQLRTCVNTLVPLLRRPCLIVGKSTVPVGTADVLADRVAQLAPAGVQAELAWNPEFLREGYAVEDTLRPERIVAGVRSATAEQVLREVYADLLKAGVPFIATDLPTAELAKVAANAFLATKISFINAMAEVCEAAAADVSKLAETLACDHRIGGASLHPGLGFGGGCLPKDLRALLTWADESGVGDTVSFLHDMEAINLRCRVRMVDLAADLAGGSLRGKRLGVLGLAFKPDSDDIRDSPALGVATAAHGRGAHVVAYDPAAMDRARRAHPELEYADSVLGAAADADLLLLLTEWTEFRRADPQVLGKVVNRRAMADGRHALDPQAWAAAGWVYRALGSRSGSVWSTAGGQK